MSVQWSRDDYIESISDKLNRAKSEAVAQKQLNKVITGGYSDAALSVMAELKVEYLSEVIDCAFSVNAVNKLTEACKNDKISYNDLCQIMHYTQFTTRNEKYVDDMLNSIDNNLVLDIVDYKRVRPETAANIFTAVGFSEMTYNDALDLVKSGAYYVTEYAVFSVQDDVARELDEMGYPLRACEGFNYCYDVDSYNPLESVLKRGAAITVYDQTIAVKVKEAMEREDWQDLRDYIVSEERRNIRNITGSKFDELCAEYSLKQQQGVGQTKGKQRVDVER